MHLDGTGFRFCPACGGTLESRLLKASDPERLVCTQCEFVFYLDPKLAVGTIIRDERDRVVLVRRAIEPGYGKWVFPGGYVDRGEQLQAAALREAREETGLEVSPPAPVVTDGPDPIENAPYLPYNVVGIGASAGGVEACSGGGGACSGCSAGFGGGSWPGRRIDRICTAV